MYKKILKDELKEAEICENIGKVDLTKVITPPSNVFKWEHEYISSYNNELGEKIVVYKKEGKNFQGEVNQVTEEVRYFQGPRDLTKWFQNSRASFEVYIKKAGRAGPDRIGKRTGSMNSLKARISQKVLGMKNSGVSDKKIDKFVEFMTDSELGAGQIYTNLEKIEKLCDNPKHMMQIEKLKLDVHKQLHGTKTRNTNVNMNLNANIAEDTASIILKKMFGQDSEESDQIEPNSDDIIEINP